MSTAMSTAMTVKPSLDKAPAAKSSAPSTLPPSSAGAASSSSSSKIDGARNLANLEAEAGDISSPHELTDWVDKVLDQLTHRFDDMRGQVEARMREMSTRIDNLETSIEDLIQGALAPIPSGAPASSGRTGASSGPGTATPDPEGSEGASKAE